MLQGDAHHKMARRVQGSFVWLQEERLQRGYMEGILVADDDKAAVENFARRAEIVARTAKQAVSLRQKVSTLCR